jgi:hypothetical protein
MAYAVKQGHVWNPIRSYPRNNPCPCGSGKKFKKCHYKDLPPTLEVASIETLVGRRGKK